MGGARRAGSTTCLFQVTVLQFTTQDILRCQRINILRKP